MQPDHYLALGIRPDASQAEVRAAYLRVMRDAHPDRRPGDPEAERAAKAANLAWEVLGDAARRGAYDRLRVVGRDGTTRHAVRVMSAEDAARIASHRAQGRVFSRQFQAASVRLGASVLVLGLLLLLVSLR